MAKIIYPISRLAGREGQAADMIHDVAVEMMGHRVDLLRSASRNSEGECQIYRKQARLFEMYATVLDAIYYQLEPERWDPKKSAEMLELVKAHNIVLPGWMLMD